MSEECYTVEIEISLSKVVQIKNCTGPHQAASKALEGENEGYIVKGVYNSLGDEWEPFSRCDGCGDVIFTDDEFMTDYSDMHFCLKCVAI